MTLLLDTNIVSYFFKRDSRAEMYKPILANHELCISLITVSELFEWAKVSKWGERRVNKLEKHIYPYTFLGVDYELCNLWGEIRADCRARGRQIGTQDAWIAATALQFQMPLVTHNESDFAMINGLTIISR